MFILLGFCCVTHMTLVHGESKINALNLLVNVIKMLCMVPLDKSPVFHHYHVAKQNLKIQQDHIYSLRLGSSAKNRKWQANTWSSASIMALRLFVSVQLQWEALPMPKQGKRLMIGTNGLDPPEVPIKYVMDGQICWSRSVQNIITNEVWIVQFLAKSAEAGRCKTLLQVNSELFSF